MLFKHLKFDKYLKPYKNTLFIIIDLNDKKNVHRLKLYMNRIKYIVG